MSEIDFSGVGLASSASDSFTTAELFAGDTPAVVTDYGIAGAGLAASGLAAWTPVYVDPVTRAVTVAEYDHDVGGGPPVPVWVTRPNAITVAAIAEGSASTGNIPVYKAGMFNIDALNWPVTIDSDGLKFSAFAEAPDAQIYLKRMAG